MIIRVASDEENRNNANNESQNSESVLLIQDGIMFFRSRESANISVGYSKSLHKDDSKSAKEQFLYMTESNEGGNNIP